MVAALALVFLVVPTEAQMGIVQRIFYFHVATAQVAFGGFFVVAIASAIYLWKGSAAADRVALAAAEARVLFGTLVLVTRPIVAGRIWGVSGTVHPRLSITVILWAICAAYLMLRSFGGDDAAVARYAAVLGIVGVIDIPVIRVSVRLLQGIHPAVMTNKTGGSGLTDPLMRTTLLVSTVAMLCLGTWFGWLHARQQRLTEEVAALQRAAEGGA